MELISPPEPPPLPDPHDTVGGALLRPLGQPSLERFLEPGDRVAVTAPEPDHPEGIEFAVEAVFDAARRVGVAAIGLYGAHDASAPHRSLPGGGRALRPIAEADKVVAIARIALCPLRGFGGGGWDLAAVAADRKTLLALHEEEGALPAFLSALPPIFLVELAFQRGGRPSAVFAGALEPAHREASAYWRRWRAWEKGAYDGLAIEVERPAEVARAILLAGRGLADGGALVVAGRPPPATSPPLGPALHALRSRVELHFADDLPSALRLLESLRPGGRLGQLPDPLRVGFW